MPEHRQGSRVLSDLVLRSATEDDAAVLADLFLLAREGAYPAMPRPVHDPDDVHVWFAAVLSTPDSEVWLVEPGPEADREDRADQSDQSVQADTGVLGYAILQGPWLHSLYVHPDVTSQGIGGFLLDVVKGVRPDGFGLWVFISNDGARRFYRRAGLLELESTDGASNEEGAPDVHLVWPGEDPLGFLRREIDEVDTELARSLSRRAAITAAIQQVKQVRGHAGRDPDREAEIARRMAQHAPALGAARLQRIVSVVITESLDAAGHPASGPG